MLKLQSWVKAIVVMLISSVTFVVCGAEERFDFELHKAHFLRGEYTTTSKAKSYTQTVEITFKDGCAVKYDADLQSGRTSRWRWSQREIHGTLMDYKLKYEKT